MTNDDVRGRGPLFVDDNWRIARRAGRIERGEGEGEATTREGMR